MFGCHANRLELDDAFCKAFPVQISATDRRLLSDIQDGNLRFPARRAFGENILTGRDSPISDVTPSLV
jgi:hypothetical protein